MDSKRSYLETLNAGRQRRPAATLEQITQSLQDLEQRIDRTRDQLSPRPAPRQDQTRMEPAQARRPAFESFRQPHQQPRAAAPDPRYQTIARDLDRIRGQEEGVASAGRIAAEIKSLRDDLRHQMTSNMQSQFDALRHELERALSSTSNTTSRVGSELASEIERISGAINHMAERGDDRNLNLLRQEIDQVKRALDKLAREDSVKNVDRRWDEFDRRWDEFERRSDERRRERDPEIVALMERLEGINTAVASLPSSSSLNSLEEKVRILAGSLDQFIVQQEKQAPETFRVVEERLDEISRAIVAVSAAAQAPIDPEPFERIEARISNLARQIDEVAEDKSASQVMDRLGLLSQRVDEIAEQASLPQRAVERLSGQISAIAEKIEKVPAPVNPDAIFQGIEQRFDILSAMIDRRQGDAIEQGNLLFRDLEGRLEDLAERIDARSADTVDHARVMSAIDFRFSELADQLASNASDANAETMRAMEGRLADISARIEASAREFAGIDPDLIQSLESQVAALSDHLSRPASPLPELEDIGPRLDELERAISGNRDTILEAAREAAESAVRTFNGSQTHTAAVSGLAEDLRALEALTRRSDERNARTFEAIHDTLIKIVDRLGSLAPIDMGESAEDAGPIAELLQRKVEIERAPPMVPLAAAPLTAMHPIDSTAQPSTRSPAAAAAEAALAASESEPEVQQAAAARGLLGGIGRAFAGRGDAPRTQEPDIVVPGSETADAPSLDAPLDPKVANRPLQPGSGAPDLNAIMKKVREERGQSAKPSDADAAKADFIAAARRAAQAAAAEAEILKRGAGAGDAAKPSRFGELVRAKRKPILMAVAAVMVALAGLQLGQAYLSKDEAATVSSQLATPPAEQSDLAANDTMERADAPTSVAADESALQAQVPLVAKAPGIDLENSADPVVVPADAAPAPRLADAPVPQTPKETGLSEQPAIPAETASVSPTPVAPLAAPAAVPAETPKPAAASVTSLGVPVDVAPLALREAADGGDAKALFEVASRYGEGRGVKQDPAQAAKWYEKSAELGFAPAQYRIGNMYEKGQGVERDVAKSKTWYQLAAEQGNASAMHNLAVLYAMGADGTTDNETAVRWFRKAAEFGVKDSQFNLGILAAKGVGMKQDLEESYRWFAIVAKSGDRDAAGKRDEIANSLRPEQLEKARAATELWKPQPVNEDTNSVEIPESWQDAPATTASVDMKKAIGNIQRILNKNGYDAGSADGIMGQKTKNAIVSFQKDNNLPANGAIDEALVKALLAKK